MKRMLQRVWFAIVKGASWVVVFVRPVTSSIFWHLWYRWHRRSSEAKDRWQMFKGLPMLAFDKEINDEERYPYKRDSLKGIVDSTFSIKHPDYFFRDLRRGRDCDDWARVWTLWAHENGHESTELVVVDPRRPMKRHAVAVIKVENKYWLANYHAYGLYTSLEEAMSTMKRWGYSEDSFYFKYHYRREF